MVLRIPARVFAAAVMPGLSPAAIARSRAACASAAARLFAATSSAVSAVSPARAIAAPVNSLTITASGGARQVDTSTRGRYGHDMSQPPIDKEEAVAILLALARLIASGLVTGSSGTIARLEGAAIAVTEYPSGAAGT